MKKLITLILLSSIHAVVLSQVVNTAAMDTTDFRYQGKVTVEGYIDTYYAYDFNKPASGNRPYSVSMARHNEFTINLAYVSVKYSSSRLRGKFVPGFGTYMNANYTNESSSLRNIVEASAGVKLWKNKNVWLDVGVFGSPYTNESAISKDHLAYTRSFAPEYVPYYLSGVKLSVPLSAKLNAYFYLLNGWQQIQDVNNNKSKGNFLSQSAIYDQQSISIRSLETSIVIGVKNAIAIYNKNVKQLAESESTVAIFSKIVENEKTKLKIGTATLLDVVNIENQRQDALLNYINYKSAFAIAISNLRFQTGDLISVKSGDDFFQIEKMKNFN